MSLFEFWILNKIFVGTNNLIKNGYNEKKNINYLLQMNRNSFIS